MFRETDLANFGACYHKVLLGDVMPVDPKIGLARDSGIPASAIGALTRALQIAAVLGDVDSQQAIVARSIWERLPNAFIVGLDDQQAWQQAIAWVVSQPVPVVSPGFTDRSKVVGEACKRLRSSGYDVSANGYGVVISESSQESICRTIDGLVAHIGGIQVISQLCHLVGEKKLVHDGMWLFGDRVPSIWGTKQPSLPLGWLLSLGLKHLASKKRARKPEISWRTVVALMTDFAAALDCQRYSQFEEIDISPSQSWRTLRDALLWREMFSVAQVPNQVLPYLEEAFSTLIEPAEEALFDWDIKAGFGELAKLLSFSTVTTFVQCEREVAKRDFPNLIKIGIGEIGKVNSAYLNPVVGGARNQSEFVFFALNERDCLSLPSPFLREAFCQALFKQLWTQLPPARAQKLVGDIFERSLARACDGKTDVVLAPLKYKKGKNEFEIDIGTRTGDRVTLFEVKSKALTASARSGDMMNFYEDYANSFLAMVYQLVRGEEHLRQGLTPLTAGIASCENLRPTKIAVSPLSYGPISDHVLANTLLRSFANATLRPLSPDDQAMKVTNVFNKKVRGIYDIVPRLAPVDADGSLNLHGYFMDIFWLDLGHILYALDRAHSVADALRPLQFITYSTRDFWTEVAFVDVQLLSQKYWRPV